MGGTGSGEGEVGLFLRFRLVCILILCLLLSLESLGKLVWWWWVVCKPILVFSLSLGQAGKKTSTLKAIVLGSIILYRREEVMKQ